MEKQQHDPLLLDTLRDLRSAVDRVQASQDKMRDKLHMAVLENTKLTGELEDKITSTVADAIRPVSQRVAALEDGTKDIERKAKQWGAIGGAGAVVTAGLTAVVALFGKTITGQK